MPDENKTTNTNQPITGGAPAVDQPDPSVTSTTPTTSPFATPPSISDQAIDTPPPPPMEDGAVSPPPPIVEEKKQEETAAPPQETETTKSTQEIPNIPPVITTSGTGEKKPMSKKMIATILGVLVLVGGIGAGVILVQNQQDIREKAGSCTVGYTGTTGECRNGSMCRTYRFANCDTEVRCDGPSCTASSPRFEDPPPEGTSPPSTSSTPEPPNACDRSAPSVAPGPDNKYCTDKRIGSSCENRDGTTGTCQEIGDSSLGGTQVECKCEAGSAPAVSTPEPTGPEPTDRPSLPPGVTASCLNIKVFDAEWNSIISLSSLVPGDVVRFTVAGTTSSGSFDKARFKVNGTLRPEVSVKRPGTNEFYDEYTIPEGITTFTINAEVHHSSLGWF